MRLLVKTALKDFSVLVEEISKAANKPNNDLSDSEKGAIKSQTGRVWDACDEITAIASQGVVGHVIRRVQEWHDLVKDAISELEEWDPEDDDDDDAAFEELMGSDVDEEEEELEEKTGKNSTEEDDDSDVEALHKQKKSLLRALKPIAQIYPAIISNRCKKGGLTASKSQIAKLESLTSDLQSIPGHVDEAAGSLYESYLDESTHYLNVAKTTAERAVDLVTFPWTEDSVDTKQQGDKFTTWSTTWKKVMGDVLRDAQP